MRYRLMAIYLGVPYHTGLGPDGSEATLFSPAPPPDELGFTAAGGHWRKQVSIADLDALWQSRLVGEYRGEPCLVLDDLGDRLHIVYLGRDSVRARQLGYWEIDREVFEVVVARQDIDGLTEERVDYPLASAMFPPSNRDPAAQPRPEAPGRGAPAPQAPGGQAPPVAERTSPLRVVPRPGPRNSPSAAEPGGSRAAGGYAGVGGHPEPGYEGPGYDEPLYEEPVYEEPGFEEPGGYPDRASSTPARVAAWHGSPETEPWPEPPPDPRLDPRFESRPDFRSASRTGPQPELRAEPGTGPQPEFRPDPLSDPRADPRSDPRADLRPDPLTDPWPERRADPRSDPLTDPWPEGRADPRADPWPEGWPTLEPWSEGEPWAEPEPEAVPPAGRRAGRRDRVPQSVFAELLSLAAIPHAAYAVDDEVPGAMCLVKADGGFEVFSRTDDARLDVRFFEDEEAAYFYLFGVLAAEAVRSGRLLPRSANGHRNGSRGTGVASAATENVSKYLRRRKLPKSASRPVIV